MVIYFQLIVIPFQYKMTHTTKAANDISVASFIKKVPRLVRYSILRRSHKELCKIKTLFYSVSYNYFSFFFVFKELETLTTLMNFVNCLCTFLLLT